MGVFRKIYNRVKPKIIKVFPYKHGILDEKVQPVSDLFGYDRGTPIDRIFIADFLEKNKKFIKGKVLEIGERTYTKKYGGKNVTESCILHVSDDMGAHSIKGNLETGEGIEENQFDCFILTQTLPFIFDIHSAAKNIIKALVPGGVALITCSGICRVSRYDMDRWGHYWGFTDYTLHKLFAEFVPEENISTCSYGNVKTAACFLYGLSAEELDKDELLFQDNNYQLTVMVVVRKPY